MKQSPPGTGRTRNEAFWRLSARPARVTILARTLLARTLLARTLLAAAITLAACQPPAADTSTTPVPPPAAVAGPAATPGPAGPSSGTVPATAASPAVSPVAAASPPPPASPPAACRYGPARRVAQLQERAVTEASGLAASPRWPDVYWTLNDSGNAPNVYAFDRQGRARGTFRVAEADNDDWEALSIGPGPGGAPALYIGDLGDNDGERRKVVIYRVPEPEPAPPGAKPATRATPAAEAFALTYPGGPRNTEAMLVHPKTGEIVLITKEASGRAVVFRVPLPLDGRRTVQVEEVGRIDTKALVPPGGLVVDAAVSPDARHVAVRTYGNVLEYELPAGASLASIWSKTPRVSPMSDGLQAEGISYRMDGGALLTIAEGWPASVFETSRQC